MGDIWSPEDRYFVIYTSFAVGFGSNVGVWEWVLFPECFWCFDDEDSLVATDSVYSLPVAVALCSLCDEIDDSLHICCSDVACGRSFFEYYC